MEASASAGVDAGSLCMAVRRLAAFIAAGAAVPVLCGCLLLSVAPARAGVVEEREIRCLALTIYHEARGEPRRGMLAVGHVVMNRTRTALFPADACAVVQQGGERRHHCQFSWWCDGRSDRPRDAERLRESLALAAEIYGGCTVDPTAGALWYHAARVEPSWSMSLGPGERIGRHVFYRGDRIWPLRATRIADSQRGCPRGRSPDPVFGARTG
jgi:hypothetical protein